MSETKQFHLLYPDLISKSDLISILKQRYIKTESLEFLDKDALVDLYNKYILPLPQRKYRNNKRGRQMTKKQILYAKKRRLDSSEDNQDDQPKNKRQSTGNLLTSFDLPSSGSGDRLKPPPSCVNFEKKKIKLKSDSKPSAEAVSSTLNKLKINRLDSAVDDNISIKKIKLSDNSNNNSSNRDNNCSNNISSSKSDDTSSASLEKETSQHNQTTKIDDDSSVKEKKKKIKKISWP